MLRSRKKTWIGHTLRGDGLFREVLEGRMKRKRINGKPRLGMFDEIMKNSYEDMKRMAEDRESWKSYMPWTCRKAVH